MRDALASLAEGRDKGAVGAPQPEPRQEQQERPVCTHGT
jgi:hypothetical protein